MDFAKLFTFDGWDEHDMQCWQFYRCVWLVDFGPWKQGDCVASVCVSLDKMLVEEYNENGDKIVKSHTFTIKPD
jgi:hypothetical protein